MGGTVPPHQFAQPGALPSAQTGSNPVLAQSGQNQAQQLWSFIPPTPQPNAPMDNSNLKRRNPFAPMPSNPFTRNAY